MRYTAILAVLVICVLAAGCERQSQLLPATGDCIYCPHCNTNICLRIQGTSRTSFTKTDYIPLVFDMDIPLVIRDHKCPICDQHFVDTDERGRVVKVYYRRYLAE